MATGAARSNERTHDYPLTQFSEKSRFVYYDEFERPGRVLFDLPPGWRNRQTQRT